MTITSDIETALRQLLPQGQQHAAGELARLVEAARDGAITEGQAQARLSANPVLAQVLGDLAGRRVEVAGRFISFKNAQVGEVIIEDAGRDIVKLQVGAIIYYTPVASTRSPQEQRNRKAMLTKVRTIWIDGLLNRSLTDELRIELNLTDRPDLLNFPLNAIVQELERPLQALPPGMPISKVFDQVGGELLILGAPGAGKTTLLLELLRDLLQRAERDEAHPIPIVFPLSTWATERKPLKKWLVDQLNVIYDVPRKIGQAWVAENEVLPLLDGLDEVAGEHRDACVEAINTYRRELGGLAPTAVASRIADYEALKRRLRLRGAVLVEALTKGQVEIFLAKTVKTDVYALMQRDQELITLLNNPLMLSIVTILLQTTSLKTLWVDGTIEQRRDRLWEAYVKQAFTRRSKQIRYSQKDTERWLAWLATRMRQSNVTILNQFSWIAIVNDLAFGSWIPRNKKSNGTILDCITYLMPFILYIIYSNPLFVLFSPHSLITQAIRDSNLFPLRRIGLLDLPDWNFLRYCADYLLLRQIREQQYIFIHRMLLEHFAAKYEEPT